GSDRHRGDPHRATLTVAERVRRAADRLIGSIRRECLDHIIISNERGLRWALAAYVDYYLTSRTHLALNKAAPVSRSVATTADGEMVAIPCLGGLHHRYDRRAAYLATPPPALTTAAANDAIRDDTAAAVMPLEPIQTGCDNACSKKQSTIASRPRWVRV